MEIGGEKVQLGIPDQLRGMAPMLTPLGRPGTPGEAAGGIFLLCTPWANYIHGQVLNITGGQFGGWARSAAATIREARTSGEIAAHEVERPVPADV